MLAPLAKKLLVTTALAALAALLVAAAPSSAAAAAPTVGVYDSLANLRPDRPAPAGATQQATLSAARNEAESFQLLIRSDPGDQGLSVDPGSPLTGPGGATLPASSMTIYRESYYQVTQRSDGEGDTGAWPDALIPERDDFYGERRDAFPVDVAAGGQVAAWVDVLVPLGQAAGDYSGSVTVSDSSGTIAEVPVTVTVQDFSLPSTSSLKSAFFVSSSKICSAFTGSAGCDSAAQAWQLESLFAEAGLDDRVTIANAYAGSPSSPYFAQDFAPLLNGTDPRVQLPGAELTSVEAYGPSCGDCLTAWKSAAEQYDFADRFFLYDCDEPETDADWSQCKQTAQSADQQWPGVQKLVTAPFDQAASSYVSTFAPLVNDVDPASGSQRPAYDGFLGGAGKSLWLYTSCRSYSCDSSEGSSFNGWPGYAIDEPASQARAMGWISYLYGAAGELYYSATQSLTTATTDQYASGGNGDGNLFYAGTPNGGNGSIAVGGSHDIPIESIRLKRIRDGREDYEYLHLLDQRGDGDEAKDIVRGLFGPEASAGHDTTVSSVALNTARAQLAAAITGQPAPTQPEDRSGGSVGPQTSSAHAVATSAVAAPAAQPADTAGEELHLQVIRVAYPHTARALGQTGVRALVVCTVACQVDLGSKVSVGAAHKLGLGSTRIGSGSTRLGAGSRGWVTARLSGAARHDLVRVGGVRVRLRTDLRSRPV